MPLALLALQKQQTKSKKYNETQTPNKPKNHEPSELRSLRKDMLETSYARIWRVTKYEFEVKNTEFKMATDVADEKIAPK